MRFILTLGLLVPALASPIIGDSAHAFVEERQAVSSSALRTTSRSTTTTRRTTTTSSLRTSTTSRAATTTSSVAPAASSPVATGSAGGEDTANAAKFLQLHNDFRAHYGASAMTWNSTLAQYAYKAASTCSYGHTGGPYGENIAAGAGGGYDVTKGFNSWADESQLYDWNNPGYSSQTGHFTQIVWKGSSQLGCAAVTCPDGKIFTGYGPTLYLVCEYAPPGNWVSSNSATTAQYFRTHVGTYQA